MTVGWRYPVVLAHIALMTACGAPPGDPVEIGPAPDHGLTIAGVSRIYDRDHDEADRFLEVPQLSNSWKRWALRLASS